MVRNPSSGAGPNQGQLDLGPATERPATGCDDPQSADVDNRRIVSVLPDVAAIGRTFDYLVPESWTADGRAERLTVGSRVRILLHSRRVGGWVLEDHVEPVSGVELRPLARLSGLGPSEEILNLAQWAAHRWAGPVAGFLATASSQTMIESLPSAAKAPMTPVAGDSRYEEVVSPNSDGSPVVVRLPPGNDPLPLVLTAAKKGDALVLLPNKARAKHIATRLRRAGLSVASMPEDWAKAAAGGVVVGSRAAAWAPVRDLQCVVVLDEHDDAYREERSPNWNARDVAIERARRCGAACVLTSPVPSLEALEAACSEDGDLRLLEPSRAGERAGWPVVDLVDRRKDDPGRSGLFSPVIVETLRGSFGDPVICVLNRKGRSRLLACDRCGELSTCVDHQVPLVLERGSTSGEDWLQCPVDGALSPMVCDSCGATRFRNLRAGVSRVREELEALAGRPAVEVTAETPLINLSAEGQPCLFVGTEAVLHRISQRVARVVFLEFDQELLAPRMRATEQALALLARAARLLGPRSAGGRLVVQTRQPNHEVLQAILHADPARTVSGEQSRRRLLGVPPFGAMARVSGASAAEFIRRLEGSTFRTVPGVDVMGPRNDAWLIRAPNSAVLSDFLAGVDRPSGRFRVEVDPARA